MRRMRAAVQRGDVEIIDLHGWNLVRQRLAVREQIRVVNAVKSPVVQSGLSADGKTSVVVTAGNQDLVCARGIDCPYVIDRSGLVGTIKNPWCQIEVAEKWLEVIVVEIDK